MSILPKQSIDSTPSVSSYQWYFHRTRTNNFTICMEIKNLESPKQSWERRMGLEESICLTSGSTTKPQSSKQYGTGTKKEI